MYMSSRIVDLRNKQVVCTQTGCILGYVSDVEFSLQNGQLLSIVIFGRPRFWGLFGREEDIIIPWDEIKVIGQETVLVTTDPTPYIPVLKKHKFF